MPKKYAEGTTIPISKSMNAEDMTVADVIVLKRLPGKR
jgi:hypothetical protein